MNGWPADFKDACERHWEDGDFLYGDARWANADHFYGLSAECGLKWVMCQLGMAIDTEGAPEERKHRVHIDRLWETFHSFAEGPDGAKYVAMLPEDNPFQDWSIHQRYAHREQFANEAVLAHRSGVDAVREVLRKAEFEGRT